MSRDWVDEDGDKDGVNQVHGELSALSHCTGYDSSRCCAEDSLEDQEAFFGQTIGIVEHAVEEVRHADETTVTEHQTEADKPEKERAEGEVDEVLHQDVSGVLRAGEASLDHCEARLHEEDEHCCEEHPDGVDASCKVADRAEGGRLFGWSFLNGDDSLRYGGCNGFGCRYGVCRLLCRE